MLLAGQLVQLVLQMDWVPLRAYSLLPLLRTDWEQRHLKVLPPPSQMGLVLPFQFSQ